MLGFKSPADFYMTLAVAVGAKDVRGGIKTLSQDEASQRIKGKDGYVAKMTAALVQKGALGINEAVDSDGAIFLMPEIAAGLLTTEAQIVNVRNYAHNFPVSGLSYEMPALVDKDHSTSVAGGVVVSRKGEAAAPDASKPAFEKVNFKVTKQTGITYITEEMLADAVALAGLIPGLFGLAMDFAEAGDFLTDGSGAGEPLAAFHANNPSLITVAAEAAQTATTLNVANVLKMRSRCYDYGGAVWVANQDILPQIATFTIGNMPVYLPSMRSGRPGHPPRPPAPLERARVGARHAQRHHARLVPPLRDRQPHRDRGDAVDPRPLHAGRDRAPLRPPQRRPPEVARPPDPQEGRHPQPVRQPRGSLTAAAKSFPLPVRLGF
jgi:hypothetical protein